MATLKQQKARKEYVCSKCGTEIHIGDQYLRFSLTRFQKPKILCLVCRPTRSQMTTSAFWGTMYAIEDEIGALTVDDFDGLSDTVEGIVGQLEELRDEQEEKRDNMPEGLQDGEIGELLQERYDEVDEMIIELQGVELGIDTEGAEEDEIENLKQGVIEEVQGASYSGS